MIASSFPGMWAWVVPELGNHLWQSTVFTGAVGVLALSLRRYQARVRYWLWLAASLKFLVPFSLLVSLGSHLSWPHHLVASKAGVYAALDGVSQSFSEIVQVPFGASVQLMHAPSWVGVLPVLLAGFWLCGFVAVLGFWIVQWRRIYVIMRNAQPLRKGREVTALREAEQTAGVSSRIEVRASRNSMGPGVFGVVRPVLLWPEGISQRLDDAQLEAVLAHEVCHVQRRDNLTSLLHMLVEALFWFHPLVWWMEGRLVEERERACDEAVLRLGKQPVSYVESILKVCEFCVESPLACVSGVTGADLKKRIVYIMTAPIISKLDLGRKLLLIAAGSIAIAVPILFGQVLPEKAAEEIKPPTLEVVSVREHKGNGGNNAAMGITEDGLVVTNVPLMFIIQTAFTGQFSNGRIFGMPSWEMDKFDIVGKVSDADLDKMRDLTQDQKIKMIIAMLQTVLADRFQMKFHKEDKEGSIYEMVVAKGGSKLRETIPDRTKRLVDQRGRIYGPLSLKELADALSGPITGRLVVDKTELTATYDLALTWTPDQGASPFSNGTTSGDASGPSIFTAVQEQLGLKLNPAKGAVPTIVIDHIEKPSAN